MKKHVLLKDLRAGLKLPGRRQGISDWGLRKRLARAGITPVLVPAGRYMRAAITTAQASRVRQEFFAKHRKEVGHDPEGTHS